MKPIKPIHDTTTYYPNGEIRTQGIHINEKKGTAQITITSKKIKEHDLHNGDKLFVITESDMFVMNDITAEYNRLEDEVKQNLETIKRLGDENVKLKSECKTNYQDLKNQYDTLLDDATEFEDTMNEYREKSETLSNDLINVHSELSEVKEKLDTANRERDDYSTKFETEKVLNSEREKQLNKMQEQYDKLFIKYEKLNQQHNEYVVKSNSILSSIESRIDNMNVLVKFLGKFNPIVEKINEFKLLRPSAEPSAIDTEKVKYAPIDED